MMVTIAEPENGTPDPTVGERLHEPVLMEAVLSWLQPQPGASFCDATVGMGGHARAILERTSPNGRLVGIDRDRDAIAEAGATLEPFGDRVTLVHAPFSRTRSVLEELGAVPLDGILVDLGVSSPQLDRPARGFSFRSSGPLDMRMDQSTGETLADLLRRVEELELENIIREYGEERFARRIARAIIVARDGAGLETTADLAAVVARAMPHHERHKSPATRTFQALRIVLNDELGQLAAFLDSAIDCLKPGGRLCVISFHSLEDRIAKRRLRLLAGRDGGGPARLRILTKHVVVADDAERDRNPRSRSAKLRAVEKL
jgi:16S rRNA (cytosine1402-N4)-methyltransferase